MYRDKHFDVNSDQYYDSDAIAFDVELKKIVDVMSRGDKEIAKACTAAMFTPLQTVEDIKYRQDNVNDALKHADLVRKLYDIVLQVQDKPENSMHWLSSSSNIANIFSHGVNLLKVYIETIAAMLKYAEDNKKTFTSDGFSGFVKMFLSEIDGKFVDEAKSHLKDLRDQDDMLIRAKLGPFNRCTGYVLVKKEKRGLFSRSKIVDTLTIKDDDIAGGSDLAARQEIALNETVTVLAQVAKHLYSFFTALRYELAFYIGAINLAEKLKEYGAPICIPEMLPITKWDRSWRGLYDVSLVITKSAAVTGNELDTKDKYLYIITGANQGGKSTFLRSFGQAQLMAQSGLFVGAEQYKAPIRNSMYTHFKREEDAFIRSGKLEEEMARMSTIADHITPGSLMIFNESFAATNEREGSEIHRQIVQALIENGVEVFAVSHQYTFAAAFLEDKKTQFLRAGRLEDGARTFKITPGVPLETAYGEDIYQELFVNRK
jgi:DNA mismatch repair ATPase MutS